MILKEGKNLGSPSDAKKIRKAENSAMRERSAKSLEQDVEAELRQADDKRRSGLGKAETPEM